MEENRIAKELKSLCENNRENEENVTQTGALLYELGKIRRIGNFDKLKAIQNVALFNAAIVRSPENKEKIETELKEICLEIIEKAKQVNAEQLDVDLVNVAKTLKKAIAEMRENVNKTFPQTSDEMILSYLEKEKILQIRNLQNKITTDYTQIMANLSDYCKGVMGEAPCKFAVIGMGSLARKEITPYSDFEHIIVLQEGIQRNKDYDEILEYFRWYSVIFQVVVINLQETILPSVSVSCLNSKDSELGDWFYDAFTTRGISFDGMMPHACKFPLGRQEFTKDRPWKTELIKPVSEMLKYLTTEEDLKNGYHLKDILTKVCFVYGDKIIFDDFEFQMFEMLEEEDEQSRTNEIKRHILEDLENFSTRSTLPEIISSKEFNLKKVIYRSTTLFISALGRLYNVRASSSFEIIEHLAEKHEISESMKHKLMYAVALACEIRLKWYMECKRQADSITHKLTEKTAIQALLKISTKTKIVYYFRIAYSLQCDIGNRLNLKKKFFYSNPTLFNSNLYYCLGDMQSFKICANKVIKGYYAANKRLWAFDDIIVMLENQSETNEISSNDRQVTDSIPFTDISSDYETHAAIASYIFDFGEHLYDLEKYDEALEYFFRYEKLQNEAPINTFNETKLNLMTLAKKIPKVLNRIGCCYMKTNEPTKAMEYLQRSLKIQEQKSLPVSSNEAISVTLHDIGRCMLQMKNFNKSMDYLNRSLEIKNSILLSSRENLSILLYDIGYCFMEMNKLTNAIDYLKQSLESSKGISFSSGFDPSVISHQIGRCFMKIKKFSKAIDYLKQSLEIQKDDTFSWKSSKNQWVILNDIGHCLSEMNRFCEAIKYLEDSLKIQKQASSNASDRNISTTLHDIGCCYLKMNEPSDALNSFKQSLDIQNQIASDPDVNREKSITLREIGCCHMKMKNFNTAMNYFNQSQEIQEGILSGVDLNRERSITIRETGSCLMKMDKLSEAMDLFKKSLDIQTKFSSNIDSEICLNYYNIGCCKIKTNNFSSAMDYLKRSLEIQERISLDTDIDYDLSRTLYEIGVCLIKMKNFTEAINFFERSLKIKEQIIIKNQRTRTASEVSAIYHRIGNCYIKEQKYCQAMNYLNKSKEINVSTEQEKRSSILLHDIGRCHMKTEQFTEALEYFKQSLMLKNQLSSKLDVNNSISITLYKIGRCYAKMNKFDNAIDYLKQSLKSKSSSEEIVASTLRHIGSCYMKMKNLNEARNYLKKSLEMKESISQADCKNLADTLHMIGCCCTEMNQLSEGMSYLQSSLEMKKRLSLSGLDKNVAITLHEIGCCFMQMNKLNEAMDYLKQSLKIQEEMSSFLYGTSSFVTYYKIGCCYIKMNKITEATNYLKQSEKTETLT